MKTCKETAILILSAILLKTQLLQAQSNGKFSQDTECGKTKGCYSNCAKGCTFEVAWEDKGTAVTFTMRSDLQSQSNVWTAIGLSQDTKMGSDEVIECRYESSGTVSTVRSQNDGKTNKAVAQTGIQTITQSATGDVLTCSFDLQKSAINLDADYYMFFANGQLNPNRMNGKSKHQTFPKISPSMVDLQSVQVIGGTAQPILIKVHGLLMIAAWILFASIGVVLARYYKPMWADRKLLGEKVWFQFHRGLMILTLSCVIAAFVVIFVHVEGWSSFSGAEMYKQAHPYLGVIVTALTVMNPLMAVFRPHPEDKYRFVFNSAHWLVGTCARILAVITIFIGVTLSGADAPEYVIYILAAYVAYQLLIELILEFHECFVVRINEGKGTAYELKGITELETTQPPEATRGITFKKVVIGLHTVVIIGFTLAIMISVA
ncbi:ferric-chelate reductase 1-like [Crassostrea virginica]